MQRIKATANLHARLSSGKLELGYDIGDVEISLDVERIEVGPIHTDEEEYESNPHYRAIRFITASEVVEVSCSSSERDSLELQEVEKFSEPQVVKEASDDSWLAPKSKKKKH